MGISLLEIVNYVVHTIFTVLEFNLPILEADDFYELHLIKDLNNEQLRGRFGGARPRRS